MKKQSNPLGPLHGDSVRRSYQEPKAGQGFPANKGSSGPIIPMGITKSSGSEKKKP